MNNAVITCIIVWLVDLIHLIRFATVVAMEPAFRTKTAVQIFATMVLVHQLVERKDVSVRTILMYVELQIDVHQATPANHGDLMDMDIAIIMVSIKGIIS